MIAETHLRASFDQTAQYLSHGKVENGNYTEDRTERVDWESGRNLRGAGSIQVAKRRMKQAAARKGRQVKKPVYQVILSWQSGNPEENIPPDAPTREEMEWSVDRVLSDLGLEEHQAWIVAHKDTDTPHVHVMTNRVHPRRGTTWKPSYDIATAFRTLRQIEQETGWHQPAPETLEELSNEEPTGLEMWMVKDPERSLLYWARREANIAGRLKEASGWEEAEEALRKVGARLEPRSVEGGKGMVLEKDGGYLALSSIHPQVSRSKLERRYGQSWEEHAEGERPHKRVGEDHLPDSAPEHSPGDPQSSEKPSPEESPSEMSERAGAPREESTPDVPEILFREGAVPKQVVHLHPPRQGALIRTEVPSQKGDPAEENHSSQEGNSAQQEAKGAALERGQPAPAHRAEEPSWEEVRRTLRAREALLEEALLEKDLPKEEERQEQGGGAEDREEPDLSEKLQAIEERLGLQLQGTRVEVLASRYERATRQLHHITERKEEELDAKIYGSAQRLESRIEQAREYIFQAKSGPRSGWGFQSALEEEGILSDVISALKGPSRAVTEADIRARRFEKLIQEEKKAEAVLSGYRREIERRVAGLENDNADENEIDKRHSVLSKVADRQREGTRQQRGGSARTREAFEELAGAAEEARNLLRDVSQEAPALEVQRLSYDADIAQETKTLREKLESLQKRCERLAQEEESRSAPDPEPEDQMGGRNIHRLRASGKEALGGGASKRGASNERVQVGRPAVWVRDASLPQLRVRQEAVSKQLRELQARAFHENRKAGAANNRLCSATEKLEKALSRETEKEVRNAEHEIRAALAERQSAEARLAAADRSRQEISRELVALRREIARRVSGADREQEPAPAPASEDLTPGEETPERETPRKETPGAETLGKGASAKREIRAQLIRQGMVRQEGARARRRSQLYRERAWRLRQQAGLDREVGQTLGTLIVGDWDPALQKRARAAADALDISDEGTSEAAAVASGLREKVESRAEGLEDLAAKEGVSSIYRSADDYPTDDRLTDYRLVDSDSINYRPIDPLEETPQWTEAFLPETGPVVSTAEIYSEELLSEDPLSEEVFTEDPFGETSIDEGPIDEDPIGEDSLGEDPSAEGPFRNEPPEASSREERSSDTSVPSGGAKPDEAKGDEAKGQAPKWQAAKWQEALEERRDQLLAEATRLARKESKRAGRVVSSSEDAIRRQKRRIEETRDLRLKLEAEVQSTQRQISSLASRRRGRETPHRETRAEELRASKAPAGPESGRVRDVQREAINGVHARIKHLEKELTDLEKRAHRMETLADEVSVELVEDMRRAFHRDWQVSQAAFQELTRRWESAWERETRLEKMDLRVDETLADGVLIGEAVAEGDLESEGNLVSDASGGDVSRADRLDERGDRLERLTEAAAKLQSLASRREQIAQAQIRALRKVRRPAAAETPAAPPSQEQPSQGKPSRETPPREPTLRESPLQGSPLQESSLRGSFQEEKDRAPTTFDPEADRRTLQETAHEARGNADLFREQKSRADDAQTSAALRAALQQKSLSELQEERLELKLDIRRVEEELRADPWDPDDSSRSAAHPDARLHYSDSLERDREKLELINQKIDQKRPPTGQIGREGLLSERRKLEGALSEIESKIESKLDTDPNSAGEPFGLDVFRDRKQEIEDRLSDLKKEIQSRWNSGQNQAAKLLEEFAEISGKDRPQLADNLEAARDLRRCYDDLSSAEAEFFEAGLAEETRELLRRALETREMNIPQAEIIDRLDRRDSSANRSETAKLESEIRSRYEKMSESQQRALRSHLSESQTENLEEALKGGASLDSDSTGPSQNDTGSGQEDGEQEGGRFDRDRGYGGRSY